MEEYDYDKAGTCQECGTSYMIMYKKELVEVENEAFIYDGTHRQVIQLKIRITIDTDKCDFSGENEGSFENGVVNVNKDGVYRAYYGNRTFFVPFEDVELIECSHVDIDEDGNCYDCGLNEREYDWVMDGILGVKGEM